jgi:hypothetical protein
VCSCASNLVWNGIGVWSKSRARRSGRAGVKIYSLVFSSVFSARKLPRMRLCPIVLPGVSLGPCWARILDWLLQGTDFKLHASPPHWALCRGAVLIPASSALLHSQDQPTKNNLQHPALLPPLRSAWQESQFIPKVTQSLLCSSESS